MGIPIKKWQKEHGGSDFPLIKEGKYNAFVYDMEAKESKKGNPMISTIIKLADGEYKGRQLWTHLVLTPEAWWKVSEFFDAVGLSEDNLPDQVKDQHELLAAIKSEVLGAKVRITVGHQKWDGEDRETIKKVSKVEEDFEYEVEKEDAPF